MNKLTAIQKQQTQRHFLQQLFLKNSVLSLTPNLKWTLNKEFLCIHVLSKSICINENEYKDSSDTDKWVKE